MGRPSVEKAVVGGSAVGQRSLAAVGAEQMVLTVGKAVVGERAVRLAR
jgi:hypothetical protein